jgi:rhodanese-related sulfurtransferase
MFFGPNIQEIDSLECARWMEERRELAIIDVRTPREVQAGTVPGARHVPLHTLPMQLDGIDRDRPVVLVCRTGARSGQACAFLAGQGFDNVYNLRGGIMDWVRHGLPTGLPQGA